MPRVDFYVTEDAQADARLALACRVVEKAYLARQQVLVWCGDSPTLTRLDELLWTFSDGSFVPHDVLDTTVPVETARAPVSLTTDQAVSSHYDLLVNITDTAPACWTAFERVVEILDGNNAVRQAARERFRLYRERGIEPETHAIATDGRRPTGGRATRANHSN